jgi:hypothetical protein
LISRPLPCPLSNGIRPVSSLRRRLPFTAAAPAPLSIGGKTRTGLKDGLLGATVVYSIVVDPHGNGFVATP